MARNKNCEHNKRRTRCRDCHGGSFCEHNKRRYRCKKCGGSSICEHNKERSKCKECGGREICEHDKQRVQCKKCGGASICTHGKHGRRCSLCYPKKIFKVYVAGAERREYSFDLTLSDFIDITQQPCHYCGEKEEPRGIDRFDNAIGYTLGNSRSCCSICNRMKAAMGTGSFTEHVQRIAEHTAAVENADCQKIVPEVYF